MKRPLLLLLAAIAPSARASTSTLLFRCDGRQAGSIEAMENEFIRATNRGDCWFHVGHHTYDIGREVALHRVHGSMFSVEQQFSPPIETTSGGFAIIIEASRDGLTWTEIDRPTYTLPSTRQTVTFDFDAGGAVARFVRIREPLSAAQGLSGYVDSSNFDAEVSEVTQPVPAARPRTLACATDIMERMYPGHPCWFGGINRYDSPSVFHTYPTGGVVLTNISGSITLLPWRTDDYTGNGGNRTVTGGFVQTSVDGVNWTTAGTFTGTYGLPIAFSIPVASVAATYVRLVPEYHKGASTTQAPWKHVRAFIIDSSLTLTTA